LRLSRCSSGRSRRHRIGRKRSPKGEADGHDDAHDALHGERRTDAELVVHGQLVDQMGLIQQRTTIVHPGAWPQRVETRTRSFALQPSVFRRQQPAARLNLEHERSATVGRLVALEHDHGGLWATFVADELALLRNAIVPWYLSGEIVWKGGDSDAHDAEIRHAALVRHPAAVSTRPAEIFVGSLDSRRDRERWRLHGVTRDRIERAAEQLKHRRPDDPVNVLNRTAEREQLLRRRHMSPLEVALALEEQEYGRPPGPLRHGPVVRGSVLHVR
jgi:hypothetical protein